MRTMRHNVLTSIVHANGLGILFMSNTPDKPETAQPANGRTSVNDRAQQAAPENDVSEKEHPAAENEPTHSVLIVEDTEELAEIMRATLEQLNLRVFHETHGQQALKVFENEALDLILLDIALPDTTGWKVLEAMREQTAHGQLPVIIVITAYGDPANRLMGKLQEIYSYMMKPLTPGEIETQVSNALKLRASK